MISFLYKIFRFILFPIILLADFLQTNLASRFTPMNMGPVSEDDYSNFIKRNINKNKYVLDFGCGTGFFAKLFNSKKYLGVDINKNFVSVAKNKNQGYNFKTLKNNYLKGFEKKINLIFINNVLHHLTDKQIFDAFYFFQKKLGKKTSIFIIEPLFPKTFFSLEFFMKVLDIGNNIKTQKNYITLFKKLFKIQRYNVKKVKIGSVLIVKGQLKKL